LILVGLIIFLGFSFSKRILEESNELGSFIPAALKATKSQINTLPDYLRPIASNGLISLQKSRFFSSAYLVTLFPQAISRIISFFLFIFASFYFLKEGNTIVGKVLNVIPNDFRVDIEILFRRVNKVFGNYLRGQILLIIFMSVILFIALSVLGVKFALLIAIFSGFAEIIPIFGPIIAGAVAALTTLISGTANFPLAPIQGAIIVIIIYFIVRQLEDYFVTPNVMGKITDLHPLIILFAVLAGGHLFGVLGLILAVPIAAVIKILLIFFFDKINEGYTNKKVLGKK